MINPLLPDDRPKMPEVDFPHYTPFMAGRNQLEAMMEHLGKTPDYFKNEFDVDRRHTFPYEMFKNMGKFEAADKMKDWFYEALGEIYQEIKDKRPKEGNTIFYIGSNWTYHLAPNENGEEMVVWMRGAWVDAAFMDKPIQSPVENHIPKDMLEGY